MKGSTWSYLIAWIFVLLFAFLVFRRLVRRDYLSQGRLTWYSSLLQLSVFVVLMCQPYLFNPSEWPWFWEIEKMPNALMGVLGLIIILLGFLVAFGTMAWFGLKRAFGISSEGVVHGGPYRLTRNPQILGGYLLVIGVAIQWPSWYAVGWVLLYGLVGHLMIATEEEHLLVSYGEEYQRYCQEVPRYVGIATRQS